MSDQDWRDIPRCEGKYQVSNTGLVRSVKGSGRRGKVLVGTTYGGYRRIAIYPEPYRTWNVRVHQIVALVFIGPKPDGLIVLHRDGNKGNNHVENLYYGTYKQNAEDAIRHGQNGWLKRTHCKAGHPFDDENTCWVDGGRHRCCKTCERARKRRRLLARKVAA